MFQTKVQNNTKHRSYSGHMTNVIERTNINEISPQETDTPQTLTKLMFVGLAITSAVLFYLAISSLML